MRGSTSSNWNVTSNCRVMLALSKKFPRFASAASAPTRAVNERPGNVSICTVAGWPCARFARSFSSTFARTSMRPDSITSATGRPGQSVSPSRSSGRAMPKNMMPPIASRFSLRDTTPSIGARRIRPSMFCWARCMASLAFVRFSRATASDASFVAARDFTSSSSCASLRFASSSDSRFFCASMAPMNSFPETSSSARRTSKRAVRRST